MCDYTADEMIAVMEQEYQEEQERLALMQKAFEDEQVAIYLDWLRSKVA